MTVDDGVGHVLLLEDEPMILMDLEFAAHECDCPALSATTIAQAMRFLDSGKRICVAVLDVNLGEGQTCEPIARELDRRGIPYILHSGDLDRQDETVRRLGAHLVPKPCNAREVIAAAIARSEGQYG